MNDSAYSAAGARAAVAGSGCAVCTRTCRLIEPLAHDVREVVENLGEVAAGIPLMSTAVTKKGRRESRRGQPLKASRSGRPFC
jgi:hypothetical protein